MKQAIIIIVCCDLLRYWSIHFTSMR